MVTDGGGWTLIANRRAGYYNGEECGADLAGFFQNGCGSAEFIGRFNSFALSANIRNRLNHTEMLVLQSDGNGVPDTDDAYVVRYPQNTNLFPNNTTEIVDTPPHVGAAARRPQRRLQRRAVAVRRQVSLLVGLL